MGCLLKGDSHSKMEGGSLGGPWCRNANHPAHPFCAVHTEMCLAHCTAFVAFFGPCSAARPCRAPATATPFTWRLSYCLVPLQCYKPLPATKDELATFHSTDYLDFLQTVTTENKVCKAQRP